MEDLILITQLNDFIFCPASIYFHKLYGSESKLLYQTDSQLNGTKAHESVDQKRYTTKKDVITVLDVYSEEYGLVGKIDIYDKKRKLLVERKKHVTEIYDGYIFQLYGQYFALTEMGYEVQKLQIHSIDDNKNYSVNLPENDETMKNKFVEVISEMRSFELDSFYQSNINKCNRCIYADACDRIPEERSNAECK